MCNVPVVAEGVWLYLRKGISNELELTDSKCLTPAPIFPHSGSAYWGYWGTFSVPVVRTGNLSP